MRPRFSHSVLVWVLLGAAVGLVAGAGMWRGGGSPESEEVLAPAPDIPPRESREPPAPRAPRETSPDGEHSLYHCPPHPDYCPCPPSPEQALQRALEQPEVRRLLYAADSGQRRHMARVDPINLNGLARVYASLDESGRRLVSGLVDERHEMAERLNELSAQPDPSQYGLDGMPLEGEHIEEGGEPAASEPVAEKVDFRLRDVATRELPLSQMVMDDLGLSELQAAEIEDLMHGGMASKYDELREIYADMMGDPAAGQDFTVAALVDAIRAASTSEEFATAVRQIAQERAGTATAPDDGSGSHAERMLRAIFLHEEEIRRALEELLGPELAEALLKHSEMSGTDFSFDVGRR